MALPQRREPEESRRDYGTLPPEQPVRGTSAGFAWWWVLWLVIIGLFIWWAGWGWGGSGGWWWGNRGGYGATANGYAGSGRAAGGGAGMAGGTGAGVGSGSGAVNANGVSGSGNMAMMTGPGKQVLDATDKTSFINQHFQVNNVPVQDKINNHALWIGGNNSSRMLAVLSGAGNNAANASINQGGLVNVTGTVEKAPPASQMQSQYHLSQSDAQRVEREGAYIRATQVTTAQR